MTVAAERLPDPAFADPVFDAQESFRALLDALSRPGHIARLATPQSSAAPLSPAATALALALCDQDTPVWLDAAAAAGAAPGFLRFHCGCPLVGDAARSAFAFVAAPASMPPLHAFAIGEDRYPETATTVVIDLPALTGGDAVSLSGPGIETTAAIAPLGLPQGFWSQMAANRALFPLGVDVVLAAGRQVLGLPRSVKVEVGSCTSR